MIHKFIKNPKLKILMLLLFLNFAKKIKIFIIKKKNIAKKNTKHMFGKPLKNKHLRTKNKKKNKIT